MMMRLFTCFWGTLPSNPHNLLKKVDQNFMLVMVMVIGVGCASPPDDPPPTPTREAAATRSIQSTATTSPTPSPFPTHTPTATTTPTAGPGLDVLLGTPQALAQQAQLDDALAAYGELADLYPDKAAPRLGQAAIALRQEDPQAALKYLRMAVHAEADNLEAWRQYALLLEQLEIYEELAQAYTTMLNLKPQNADLLVARAATYARLGQTDLAIADLKEAQSIDPSRDYAWQTISAAAYSSRAYEVAIEIASAGLDVNPDLAGLWEQHGLAYLSLDDKEAAIADFDAVIDLDHRHHRAYRWRGWARAELGDNEGGFDDLQQAIDLGEQAGVAGVNEALETMADAADVLARSDPNEAFSFMARYVFSYGSREPLIVGYARIDWRRGNLDLALGRLDPLVADGYLLAQFWRGQILAEDGQTEAAIADLEAFLDIRSYGPQAEVARRLIDELDE